MKDSALQAMWSTWELLLEIKPRSWGDRERKRKDMCGEARYDQEERKIQKGLHEERHRHSFADGCGTRSMGIQSQCQEGNWLVQRERCPQPAMVFFCEMKGLGFTHASQQVLRMGGGKVICTKDTCPVDVKATFHRHANELYCKRWVKKHEIGNLKEGVRFESIETRLITKSNRVWTTCSTGKIVG